MTHKPSILVASATQNKVGAIVMVIAVWLFDMAGEPLKCPICGDVANARLQLDKHLLTEHPLTERIKCLLNVAERERDARRLAAADSATATDTETETAETD